MVNDLSTDEDIIRRIESYNLFQFPTERITRNLLSVCLKHLHGLDNEAIIKLIAHGPIGTVKQ